MQVTVAQKIRIPAVVPFYLNGKPTRKSPHPRSLRSSQLSRMKITRMKVRAKAVPTIERAHYQRVVSLPCANCGVETFSQAAHSNRYQDGKGAGLKANYLATFPLCCDRPGIVGCHFKHDQCIGMTREEADARTTGYIADTHRKLGIE
ncbi:hypothetical protein [Glaciimonas soli]|uniref:DUF968 domain-containing protein n=1 Tax=Glaciimonas soli TaxID=2590999 RepID=A0A843YS08_9BURK|nr:hypothetical protein [Glaciimonas soli]MQR02345.1 hypothetical protein [Glaciimonas soli]